MSARIGMLTPSSNTVLEPITARMLAGVPDVTAHFGRFRVTEIALDPVASAQFAQAEIMRAVGLLADARCGVIGWNGTSAAWLGFETDAALCRAIERESGALACTSVLAMNEALQRFGARRVGLVTPYTADVQARIVANYAGIGIDVASERHFGLRDNFSFAEVSEETVAAAVREVAGTGVDAVMVMCTNLRGAGQVAALERALGIPVLDSIAVLVWKALQLLGSEMVGRDWGQVFEQPR